MAMTKEEKLAYNKFYYQANKEKIAAKNKSWRESNKEKELSNKKAYYQANKDKSKVYREANKEKIASQKKAYREANKKRLLNENNSYRLDRKKTDPIFAMKIRIRGLIGQSLRLGGFTKKSKSHEILGCDWETFKEHIESRFLDGMSWENRDEWHIDHIIPVSLAQDEEAVITLNHYLNLRPLWAAENLSKKDNMPSMDLIKQYGADVIFNKLKGI
jgi:hypothetical protein